MVKKGINYVDYNLNGKIKIITFDTNVDLISNLELPNYNTKSLKFFDFNMLVGINPSNGKEITIKIIPN